MLTIEVTQAGNGIGDAVLGLCCLEGVRNKFAPCRILYTVPEKNIPYMRVFNGYDACEARGAVLRYPPDITFHINKSYQQETRERAKKSRIEYYCEIAGGVEPKVPTHKPLKHSQYKDAVVLAPFSEWKNREWLLPNWLCLEEMLREKERVVILHHKHEVVKRFKSEKAIGHDAETVCSILKYAKLVIGIDSGPMHLTGALGGRGLALCGPTRCDSVFGVYGNITGIDGKLPCQACYWQPDITVPDCSLVCAALNLIHPTEVYNAYLGCKRCTLPIA